MLIRYLILTALLISPFYCLDSKEFNNSTTPLIEKKGVEMLLESNYRDAYWPLSQFHEAQVNGTYCGIASSVMVLNALNIPRPIAWTRNTPARLFNQENFFSEEVCNRIDKKVVLKQGLTLAELSQAIDAWNVPVETLYADKLTEESFRELLKLNLVKTDRFIIANYYRPLIQGVFGGHFSPLAAYDQSTDSVLIMDVNRYDFVSTWVPLPLFLRSMQTVDSDSNELRGLILIHRPTE